MRPRSHNDQENLARIGLIRCYAWGGGGGEWNPFFPRSHKENVIKE